MAQSAIPVSRPSPGISWLDRPLFPVWQRVAALAVESEVAVFAGISLLAFILRIWDVGSRAMHHDESLHAYYAWSLFHGQGYSYDPLMHGPLQFEVVPLFYLLFGVSEFSARLLAVLLGTLLVFLPYFLRRYLGRSGAILLSITLGISPGMVYFSRFIRDDIYLACFSLVLFIALVRYLESPRPYLLYLAAAAMALAMASMEAAYITFFIFGTFLLVEGIRESLYQRDGPVLTAIRATSADTWLTALSIFVIINVLLYSTFFTNPYGIWDTRVGLLSADRKDILGGLTYWKAQHYVQRGGQPWFYYLLVLPLYEQIAVVFGIAGFVYAWWRRSLVTSFMAWWALMALGLYSWAGEKMPWLSIHITLPLLLLAATALAAVLNSSRRWLIVSAAALFTLLLALETHSTFVLNFVDGANPTEMLIYVQTSQDVPNTVSQVAALGQKTHQGTNLSIGLDNNDVGGWPYIWYLRDYHNITETASFNGPVCGDQYCAALLVLEPEFDPNAAVLMKHYVAQKFRWNWWFPEDYKLWFPQHWGAAFAGQGNLVNDFLGTGSDWNNIWNWLIFRQPFGERGARWAYFLVRRDLVPNASQFSTKAPNGAPPPIANLPTIPAVRAYSFGLTGGQRLSGPRGLTYDAAGNLYVADPLAHRVFVYSPTGTLLRTWGSVGTAPGQFSATDSPLAVAVGRNGLVYVADTWNHRIEAFTSTGKFVRSWGGSEGSGNYQFYGPRSLAIASNGNVYVADTGNKRIQVFSAHGTYLFTIGAAGTQPGQFNEPSSVALGPDGTVYVSDFWNRRIQGFSPSGRYLRSWSVPDWVFGSYDEPYLAVSQKTGYVYATDPQQQHVLVYTPHGGLLGSVGDTNLQLPIGVAVAPNGQVAVSDPTSIDVALYTLQARRLTVREPVVESSAPQPGARKKP